MGILYASYNFRGYYVINLKKLDPVETFFDLSMRSSESIDMNSLKRCISKEYNLMTKLHT